MEQKDYKLEIIGELLNGKSHVRELAKKIKTNHMTISRKIRELSKENVVDYSSEGRNKSFFLKNTIEANTLIYQTENYKLLKILEKYPFLRAIIEKIQNNKTIKLAILFGSYARGIAKQDSDIDIYVDTKDRKIKNELEMIDSKLSIKIGEFDKNSLLIKEIIKNHVIIKGVEEYHEKVRIFS